MSNSLTVSDDTYQTNCYKVNNNHEKVEEG